MEKRRLTILLALYHKACGEAKKLLNPLGLTRKLYGQFRTIEYQPEAEIVPWNTTVLGQSTDNPELLLWRSSYAPTRRVLPS